MAQDLLLEIGVEELPASFVAQAVEAMPGLLESRLRDLRHGEVAIVESGERHLFGTPTEVCLLAVTIYVHDPRFYTETAFGGSVGAGEAYMSGFWSCDDLTALIRIMVRNRNILDGMETLLGGWSCRVLKAADLSGALAALDASGAEADGLLVDYHLDSGNGIGAIAPMPLPLSRW